MKKYYFISQCRITTFSKLYICFGLLSYFLLIDYDQYGAYPYSLIALHEIEKEQESMKEELLLHGLQYENIQSVPFSKVLMKMLISLLFSSQKKIK